MLNQRALLFCSVLSQMLASLATGIRTMDEIISNAAETPALFTQSQPSGQNGAALVRTELDMVFTADQWEQIRPEPGKGRYRRKAIRGDIYRWPEAVIPYDFDHKADFSGESKAEIKKAIDEWEKFTCVTFVRASNSHADKIRFANGGGCFSNVGKAGGVQPVGLAPGCRWKSVVLHEVGHALGLMHEQTRPDRDDHVRIIERNIPPQMLYNFQKYSREKVDVNDLPYDYRSIMHYGAKAFSFNGQPTIVTIDAKYQNVIGTSQSLSFLDIKIANLIYQCHDRCRQPKPCPPEGFLDKHCQCMCPGNPVQPCSSTGSGKGAVTTTTRTKTGSEIRPTTQPTVVSNQCSDQYEQCGKWAARGECKHPINKVYMQVYCQKTCGICRPGGRTIVTAPDCRDTGELCAFWKGEGHCTRGEHVDFMRRKCPKTCGHCRLNTPKQNGGRKRHNSAISNMAHDDVSACSLNACAVLLHVIGIVCVLGLRRQ